MVGAGIGALRESRERAFRTGDQLRETIPNADFLGMLPALEGPAPKRRRHRLRRKAGAPEDNAIQAVPQRYRYALDNPLSSFAETLRSIKVAAERDLRDRVPKVVGFVSVLPGEGKSTVSKNFATLLASQGARVLLVDGDVRSAGLTRAVAPNASAGILEVVLDGRPISNVMLREPDSGLLFIPAVYAKRFAYSGDILSALDFRALRDAAGIPFDYIIVDLPPVGAVVDARAAANNLDAYVLVVEWGKTARRAIETMIQSTPPIADKLIGIVLNKVDMNKVRRYENYGSAEYYTKEYETYYRSKV
jgi:succinoglycan biosynthesis transport protein ExoP